MNIIFNERSEKVFRHAGFRIRYFLYPDSGCVKTKVSFFLSLLGKYLSIAMSAIVLFVLVLPLPFAGLFGFVRLPSSFYGWMLLIVAVYIFAAEKLKQWFYGKIESQA